MDTDSDNLRLFAVHADSTTVCMDDAAELVRASLRLQVRLNNFKKIGKVLAIC